MATREIKLAELLSIMHNHPLLIVYDEDKADYYTGLAGWTVKFISVVSGKSGHPRPVCERIESGFATWCGGKKIPHLRVFTSISME